MKQIIALAAMEKILKKAGAQRVSEDAKVALRNVLEDIALEIAEESIKLANHAGRKTVKANDIRLASH